MTVLNSAERYNMLPYKIEKNVVIETTTNQVIKKFENTEEAKKACRHLNLGGGFDGYTPNFFLKTFKIPVEVV